MTDYSEIWQMKDSITTVVEANGYAIWDIRQEGLDFTIELSSHIDEEAVSTICGQFPMTADYSGEGCRGTMIHLYGEE